MAKWGLRAAGRRGATIKDVARAAEASPMTVSDVLNNRRQFVSTGTRRHLEREIERLNLALPRC